MILIEYYRTPSHSTEVKIQFFYISTIFQNIISNVLEKVKSNFTTLNIFEWQ